VVVLPCGVPVLEVKIPFHARSFEATHRLKYIHIATVIVGLVLPTLPVIVTFTAGNPSIQGDLDMTSFPPVLCTSLKDPTFYSLVLPINILLAIGVPLLIIVFWIIHKVRTDLIVLQCGPLLLVAKFSLSFHNTLIGITRKWEIEPEQQLQSFTITPQGRKSYITRECSQEDLGSRTSAHSFSLP